MTAASYDVCAPWAVPADLVAPCCVGGYDDAALMTECLLGASTILYHLTDRRWSGVCTDTVRPTAENAPVESWMTYDAYSGWQSPNPWTGASPTWASPFGMWGVCGCDRTRVCGFYSVSQVRLPGYPVVSIDEVKINGTVIAASEYRLVDRNRLVYVPSPSGGRAGWPCCQDLTKADTEDATWSVTYKWGAAPPTLGNRYAALLACQIYQSMSPIPDGECRLPDRVSTVTRQGVTFAVLDNFSIFEKGLTGLPEVDMWITSLRVGKVAGAESAVILPDRMARRARD